MRRTTAGVDRGDAAEAGSAPAAREYGGELTPDETMAASAAIMMAATSAGRVCIRLGRMGLIPRLDAPVEADSR